MIQEIRKVFIVDDDEMLSEMLSDHLSRYGSYEIRTFGTGEECLEQLNEKPDLVIVDFNLNSINPTAANGLEIVKAIKNQDSQISVILYSSEEQPGEALQYFDTAGVNFVLKDEEAFTRISKVIEQVGMEDSER